MELAERILNGDKRAAARLISLIENEDPRSLKGLSVLHGHTGKAHIIGVTGPPGAGKSTVVDKLAKKYRENEIKIGIIAVDPTSPFTGGAILGDRIRMNDLTTDENIFIRSMGTRGHLGGLARATSGAIKVLDAFGMDKIIVETVGAGQSEVEIVSHAHTTVIIEMPGLGDEIQTIKAGIMEIGDIFVVNKADYHGADKTASELRAMLELDPNKPDWMPPILKTVANDGEGIAELKDEIEKHLAYLKESGDLTRLEEVKARHEFLDVLKARLNKYVIDRAIDRGRFDELVEKIIKRQIDPFSAAEELSQPFEKMVEEDNRHKD